ncbi:2,3-dehydroadipyl-CoA hydratase [bacterium YEK0313]|nr:2,3-dehydroadipyl-CoA hydratase [bacterium YEK0313]
MSFEQIIVERRDAALWITLNRPAALNSLTPTLGRELGRALDLAEADPAIRALVLTGAGRAFCAGADLIGIGSAEGGRAIAARIDALLPVIGRAFNRLEASRLPVIAAVNGLALAGGLELVLCCDLVIAAESAQFGDAHANYGLLPGGGGSIRLPRKIGPTRAKYWMMTGQFASAEDMRAAGLVNQVVPGEALVDTVRDLVASLADKSALGLARMKELVAAATDLPLAEGLAREIEVITAYAGSADMREGLDAFREKRKPRFTGR